MKTLKHITLLSTILLIKATQCIVLPLDFTNYTLRSDCPLFAPIDNGYIISHEGFAEVGCDRGFALEGSKTIDCIGGREITPPKCVKMCPTPAKIPNTILRITDTPDEGGKYRNGTRAIYSCHRDFITTPKNEVSQVCKQGKWTKAYITCRSNLNCEPPKEIINGYHVYENKIIRSNEFGQRLHYNCRSGYYLLGPHSQRCLEDGTWSPKNQPSCIENEDELPCPSLPKFDNTGMRIVAGYISASNIAKARTLLEIRCTNHFTNARGACKTTRRVCSKGRWKPPKPMDFEPPLCVPVAECKSPPIVPNATLQVHFNTERLDTHFMAIGEAHITYKCHPEYYMKGNGTLSCSMNGCWTPEPPACIPDSGDKYFLDVNSLNAVLVSTATGIGVLGLLLVICLIAVCRRKKPLARAVTISPPVQGSDLGDHVTLFNHPDRLALIAFVDGMQNDQGAPPSYDEAISDRCPSLVAGSRLHRPHWPVANLAGRRTRTADVTRHGSFASHTPSTRSAGDSMGSTDTMAASEGSTNVTLDTASSLSGSQPGSCRVHCGSLASFDTSSVINTEGVPLLEESELEEMQAGDNISLLTDNPSICDNGSFKLSAHSADLL